MRDARTAPAPARPSPPGSTPPPASPRARTPNSGWTPGRCTSSTRRAAATCRWSATTTGLPRSRRRRRRNGPTPGSRGRLLRTPDQAASKRLPARPALPRPGRLPDLSPQALDDLVVPFVGPDEPVPFGGDPHVGLGLSAGADHVGGPEHPDHGPVLLGEPPAGDLAAVHEPVLVLHAPASPGLDGLAELGVRPRVAEGDLGVGLLGQRDPGPEQPLVVLDQQVAAAADAGGGHGGQNLGDVGVDRGGA